jgi:hypothetical protein
MPKSDRIVTNSDRRPSVYGWIAGRLHEVKTNGPDLSEWIKAQVGHEVSTSTLYRLLAVARRDSPPQGPDTVRRARRDPREPLVKDWFLVDEHALELQLILYRLPNDGMPQPDLLTALDTLKGIRQVIEATSVREVFVVAIVQNMDEARDLRARIEEIAPGRSVVMDTIESESWSASPLTWLDLAQKAAKDRRTGALNWLSDE